MDKQLNTSLPSWLLPLYFVMLGFTFISVPHTSSTYILYARLIQAFELLFFFLLLIQTFKRGIRLNRFNTSTNIWWLFYTFLTYLFVVDTVGLTPLFKWMNIIIFLLLGTCYWQDSMLHSIKYLAVVFSFLIYSNAILLILYPDGLWVDEEWVGRGDATRYLFGNYNQIGFVCLLGITTQSIYSFSAKKGYFNLICLILVSIASVIFVGSMTSTVCLILLALGILLRRFIMQFSKTILVTFFVIYILFFIFIVWYGNSIETVRLATIFIEKILSKSTDFTARTYIWENAIHKIGQSPWIGYGVQSVEWNDTYLGGSGAHNLWLMLMLQGGGVLCGLFVYILLYTIKYTLKKKNVTSILGVVGIIVLLIMSLFEACNVIQIFLLLQLVYYSSRLTDNTNDIITNN